MKLVNEQANGASQNGIYLPRSPAGADAQVVPDPRDFVTSRPRPGGFGPSVATSSSALAGITGLGTARVFSDLPPQAADGIAPFLNGDEQIGLSSVERATHALLELDMQRVTAVDAAAHVTSFEAVRNALSRIQCLAEASRTDPMTALADHLGDLPEQERTAAFTATLAAIHEFLPMEQRSRPLVQLAWQILNLPMSARAQACHQMAVTSNAMPGNKRARPLEMVRYLLGVLPPEARQAAFLEALDASTQLTKTELALALGEHAVQLSVLASDKRIEAFTKVIDATGALDPERQVATLAELAGEISEIPERERGIALEQIIEALAPLPPHTRAPALFVVGYQHYELTASEQARLQESLDALNYTDA